jgi:UDP-glucose 4-epimerase
VPPYRLRQGVAVVGGWCGSGSAATIRSSQIGWSRRHDSAVVLYIRADGLGFHVNRTSPVKLLVTGGAGYIGSIVSRLLLASGHQVVVLDNLERGHAGAVAPEARLVVGDLRDAEMVRNVTSEGFDAVLHFAALALVSESVSDPGLYYRTNVGGSLNLLEAMREAEVPRLVFSSTCAVYGQPDEVPISEFAPPRPTNAYGSSKLAVDQMISAYCVAHGIGAASLRYFNVAGSSGGVGEDHDPETHLIPNVLRAALGLRPNVDVFGTDYPTPDGTAIRDYIHVDDLAAAHALALAAVRPGEHQIFNLGNGNGFSVREVIAVARNVTRVDVQVVECPRRPGDPPMLVAASERIRDELGWVPRKPSLEQMIGDAWEFARANPSGYPKPTRDL